MDSMTISKLKPELDKICDEHGLEKKVVAYRNTPAGEHGYLKAYEIWKQRNKQSYGITKMLATIAINKNNKMS